MEINLIADASVSSAPAGFVAAVQAAANVYDSDFAGNYTVNIEYGWGTYDGAADSELTTPNNDIASIGGVPVADQESYATTLSWLKSHAILSDQVAADASLPASSAGLPGGENTVFVSPAQEKALGEFTGNGSAIDGAIGFNDTDPSTYNFEGLALCEIGHALGWSTAAQITTGVPTLLDLFRYSAPGTRDWTSGQLEYFSIDGGATNLANFATSYDPTLFEVPTGDAFSIDGIVSGVDSLSSLDIEALNVMGFGGSTLLPPTVTAVPSVSLGEDLSVAASSLIASVANPRGDVFGQEIVEDLGGGSGYFTVNGVPQPDGGWIYPGASSAVQYVAGASPGTDTLVVGLYDATNNTYIYSSDLSATTTAPATVTGDTDLLWQNSSGLIANWSIIGAGIDQSEPAGYAGQAVSLASDWSVAGVGAFAGGGVDDVMWLNTDGAVADWTMNGGLIASSQSVTYQGNAVVLDPSWSAAGVGDFNGAGDADVLWRNTNGYLADWTMSGSQISSSQTITYNGAAVDLDRSWSLAGVGDLNGDGKSDIVWRNTNGYIADWTMNGSQIASSQDVVYNGAAVNLGPAWSLIATGDFNGDGKADLLWENVNGAVVDWTMNGSQIASSQLVTYQGDAVVLDPSWSVAAVRDLNADGLADVLWRNTNGSIVDWTMEGSQIASVQPLTYNGASANIDTSWHTLQKPTDNTA